VIRHARRGAYLDARERAWVGRDIAQLARFDCGEMGAEAAPAA